MIEVVSQITVGDIIIIVLLYVLIRKLRVPVKEVTKEAIALILGLLNPANPFLNVVAEFLAQLVKEGKLSQEDAKQILKNILKKWKSMSDKLISSLEG